jgi:hypothetical protein
LTCLLARTGDGLWVDEWMAGVVFDSTQMSSSDASWAVFGEAARQ